MARAFACAPFDLASTVTLQRLGAYDPTAVLEATRFSKAFHHDGVAVVASLSAVADGFAIDGPPGLLAAWSRSLPPDDGLGAFDPGPGPLRRLHRAQAGMRLLRVPWLFDLAVTVVLQQRVSFRDACSDWRRLVRAHGVAIGPLLALPPARVLAPLGRQAFEALGIDPRRAAALSTLAREEAFSGFLSRDASPAQIRARLERLPGIGPWTTGMILGFGLGDPDAVIAGDLHLPRLAAAALGGGGRGSDDELLALLEPYRGHRFRVARLLLGAAVPRGRDLA